ncbi:SseB family protein [Vampirovibrio sp.]|uniref:SseB family protein n=1 Tax=Vampirovibrio sp. TaxID=2717857 RepID=UPI003593CCC7
MLNQPDFSFPHQPRRLENIPGFPTPNAPPHLLEDSRLEGLVQQIEHLPKNACYPLQANFYGQLMNCDLLLPVPQDANLQAGLPLLALENHAGEKGMPLFTNEQNLCVWMNEPVDYLILPFTTLCGFALEAKLDYIILNISGPCGCEISFHDFSFMAEGMIPPPSPQQISRDTDPRPGEITIAKQTPMRLGLCPDFPKPLFNRLQLVFRHHEYLIQHVYLFNVAFHQGPLQPALGVRMPEGLEEEWENQLWPNLQAVLHEMLEKHDIVNVFLLNQAGSMENHLKTLTKPVYQS